MPLSMRYAAFHAARRERAYMHDDAATMLPPLPMPLRCLYAC